MTRPDFLDTFDMVPGGALLARKVAFQWERAGQCTAWARETLDRERCAQQVCPLFPHEFVTPHERGQFVVRALAVGSAGEALQEVATHPATPPAMRRHAAHLARWCMDVFARLFAEHQRVLALSPDLRVVSSGPLAVVWVAGGCVRWELRQFDLVETDGDLSLLVDLPAHVDTHEKLVAWTEHRHHTLMEPTPPGVGGKDMCGTSRT